MAKLFDSLYERVMSKVEMLDWQNENGCWVFMGCLDKDGYGYISRRVPGVRTPRQRRVHIVTWEAINGSLPEGMTLDHTDCIAKACCNPDHVELVTRVVNSQRSQAKRKRNAMQAR